MEATNISKSNLKEDLRQQLIQNPSPELAWNLFFMNLNEEGGNTVFCAIWCLITKFLFTISSTLGWISFAPLLVIFALSTIQAIFLILVPNIVLLGKSILNKENIKTELINMLSFCIRLLGLVAVGSIAYWVYLNRSI